MAPLYLILSLAAAISAIPRRERAVGDEGFPTQYSWGFFLPPYRHQKESRSPDGSITGSVSFIDPEGNPVSWKYQADAENGYRVVQENESPAVYLKNIGKVPEYKNAAHLGLLRRSGTDELGQEIYAVDHDIAVNAGSESQLAYNLGAIPAAAVHEGRGSPLRNGVESVVAPVLVALEDGSFRLEVPIPDEADRKTAAIEAA